MFYSPGLVKRCSSFRGLTKAVLERGVLFPSGGEVGWVTGRTTGGSLPPPRPSGDPGGRMNRSPWSICHPHNIFALVSMLSL